MEAVVSDQLSIDRGPKRIRTGQTGSEQSLISPAVSAVASKWFIGRAMATLLAISVHIALLVQFMQRFESLLLPERFLAQFQFLILLSVGASIVIVLIRNTAWVLPLIAVQLMFLAIATAPLGDSLELTFVLFAALMGQALHAANVRTAIVVTLVVFVVPLTLQTELEAWGQTIPATSSGIFALFICTQIIVGLSVLYSFWLLTNLHHRSTLMEQLMDRNRELLSANFNMQEYAIRVQSESASEERKRVTRDIHDTVCYAFTCVIMMLNEASIASRQQNLDRVAHLHRRAIELARGSLNDTRVTLRLFRELERYREPLPNRIEKLTRAFEEATGTRITVHFASLPATLEHEVEEAIQGMIQEGLANSVRHGHARHVAIAFSVDEIALSVSIHDDGEGAGPVVEGIGLSGMHERVHSAGGEFHAERLGNGFKIASRFPIRLAFRELE